MSKCLPVKKIAAKPLFWTELSVLNSRRKLLPTDVTRGGLRGPQNMPCLRNSFSPVLLRISTLSYSQSCYKVESEWRNKKKLGWIFTLLIKKLTLLPSKSKCVKLSVIRYCGGATISQMQFLFGGYRSGNEGLTIVPFSVSMTPPQASSHFLPSECNS